MPKSTCPLCNDGWPVTEIFGEMIHELPEPAGNFICFNSDRSTRYERHTIPLVYIMSPYTDPDSMVMEQSYQNVRRYENFLTVKFPDALFYSPIVHFHQVALVRHLPRDIDYWRTKNRCMIHRSQLGIVLRDEGWMISKGIKWECDLFETLNTPYIMDDPNSEHEVVGQALQKLA